MSGIINYPFPENNNSNKNSEPDLESAAGDANTLYEMFFKDSKPYLINDIAAREFDARGDGIWATVQEVAFITRMSKWKVIRKIKQDKFYAKQEGNKYLIWINDKWLKGAISRTRELEEKGRKNKVKLKAKTDRETYESILQSESNILTAVISKKGRKTIRIEKILLDS